MEPRKPMVGRVWRGRTTSAKAGAYQQHLREQTLPALAAIDGFRGAYVLRRSNAGDADFVVLTLWSSADAIQAFAGPDSERAVIPAGAAQLLAEWDERATHYDVVLSRKEP